MMTEGESVVNEELIGLLREVRALARFMVLQEARKAASALLDTDNKRRVYSASDGTKSVREIAQSTGVNKSSVSNYWREWQGAGIAELVPGTPGTRRAIFSLDDLGVQG